MDEEDVRNQYKEQSPLCFLFLFSNRPRDHKVQTDSQSQRLEANILKAKKFAESAFRSQKICGKNA